jgi:hypothetical protein
MLLTQRERTPPHWLPPSHRVRRKRNVWIHKYYRSVENLPRMGCSSHTPHSFEVSRISNILHEVATDQKSYFSPFGGIDGERVQVPSVGPKILDTIEGEYAYAQCSSDRVGP